MSGCPQHRPALSPQMTYQGHRCLLWGALCAVGVPLATSQAEATPSLAPEGTMPGKQHHLLGCRPPSAPPAGAAAPWSGFSAAPEFLWGESSVMNRPASPHGSFANVKV